MQTCTRCGAINPDSSVRCDCGGTLVAGDKPSIAEGRVAGFWIRLLSDLLDAFVLGAIGFVLARIFRGPLLRLGESAAILGAPITLLYMGVLQSHIGRGQTVAKRVLGLRVLRLDGSFLTLDRALVRWALMGVLSYGSAVAIALSVAVPFLKLEALSAALAGAQLALILGCGLLVPFHPLKRGLHDLVTGSIVIRGGRVPTEHVARFDNPRRDRALVMGSVAVAVLGTVIGLVALRHVRASLQAGTTAVASIKQLGVQNPGVVDSIVSGPSGRFHHIIATGYLPTNYDGSPGIDNAEDRILAIVRKEMPLDGVDSIVVNLRRGINLGVYQSYQMSTRVERPTPGP
ncbi:MAG TPA: RDD family protein [Polyangia bacterium]|nr:RDD family protein [Polyangia bacterium]